MKDSEVDYTWEDKSVPRVEQILLQDSIHLERRKNEANDPTKSVNVILDYRLSVEEEQFVDALTSPLEKPKDWGEQFPRSEVE